MRRIAMALLVLLSGVAASVAQPAPAKPKPAAAKQAPQNGRCDVGIISHLGEKFHVRQIGITVFGNESNDVSVESWRIDDLVVARITGALGRRATVRRIAYHKEAFASLETTKLFRDIDAEVGEGVRTLAAGTHCARYLIVTDGISGYGGTNQGLDGLGIVAGKKPYFTGDQLTLADLMLAPQLEFLSQTPEWAPLTARSANLEAWLARMAARPSMQATTWERVSELAKAA